MDWESFLLGASIGGPFFTAFCRWLVATIKGLRGGRGEEERLLRLWRYDAPIPAGGVVQGVPPATQRKRSKEGKMKFIKAISRRFSRLLDRDDMEQEMHLKSLQGGGFITCRNAVLSMLREKKREVDLFHSGVDPDHTPSGGVEGCVQFKRMLSSFSPLESYVVEKLMYGYTKREIAIFIGTSPASVSRIIKGLNLKIKEHI